MQEQDSISFALHWQEHYPAGLNADLNLNAQLAVVVGYKLVSSPYGSRLPSAQALTT
jgi:hypothetical protein